MDYSKFSRARLEAAQGNDKAMGQFCAELEKAIATNWNNQTAQWAERIMAGLNAQGHRLEKMEDLLFTWADRRPEGETSLALDVFASCGVTAKFEIPQVTPPPPETKWYLAVSESTFAKFLTGGIDALSADEQTFHLVDQMDREVNNGGFSQYFTNSAGDHTSETLEALKFIGAKKTAKLLAEAISLFPGGAPPADRDDRTRMVDGFGQDAVKKLDRLTSRYYKGADNLMALLYARLRDKLP